VLRQKRLDPSPGSCLGIHLDKGQAGLRIAADDFGVEFTLILEHDLDLVGILNNVVVGDDQNVFSRITTDMPGRKLGVDFFVKVWFS
jgi:hypothetical protein